MQLTKFGVFGWFGEHMGGQPRLATITRDVGLPHKPEMGSSFPMILLGNKTTRAIFVSTSSQSLLPQQLKACASAQIGSEWFGAPQGQGSGHVPGDTGKNT